MKKILTLSAFALAALPAMAASTTVEFVPAEGKKVVIVLNDDGTAIINGAAPVAYTMDEAAKQICSTVDGKPNCATFKTWGTKMGHTTPYTTSQGSSGIATVTAKTE